MANFQKIQAALITAWDTSSLGLNTAYENSEFQPVDGVAWARIVIIPTSAIVATLGSGGEDEHLGTMWIDLFYPPDKGNGDALEMAGRVEELYQAGSGFTYSGQTVTVRNPVSRSGGRIDENWYRLTLRIDYRARTFRTN